MSPPRRRGDDPCHQHHATSAPSLLNHRQKPRHLRRLIHRPTAAADEHASTAPTVATMRPLRARPLAIGLAAASMLGPITACAAPTEPPTATPQDPTSSTLPAASTATPTLLSPSAPPTFDVVANMPPKAKEHTDKGAEAFARYFFETMSRTIETPSPGQLPRLCTPDLEPCAKRDAKASQLALRHEHLSGPMLRVITVIAIPDTPLPEQYRYVTVTVRQLSTRRLSESGAVLETWSTEQDFVLETRQVWQRDRWLIDDIGNISDRLAGR